MRTRTEQSCVGFWRSLRWRRIRAVLAGALVLGVGFSVTLAAWIDEEYARTSISAGTFELVSRTSTAQPFESHGVENTAQLELDASNLYPGQSRAAFIQVKNAGTVPGTVRLSDVTVDMPTQGDPHVALRNALHVRVVRTSAPGDAAPACTPSTSGGVAVDGLAQLPAFNPPTVEVQPGGANTVSFCFIVTLTAQAPSSAQGGRVTPTWTFLGTTPET